MASSESMAAADSRPERSILSESLKLLSRNTKPVLPIFLLSLIPCSLMLFSSSGPINPLILESLTMPYPTNTSVVDFFSPGFNPRSYGIKALSTVTVCHLLFFLPIVAGIRSLSLISAGQELRPRESFMEIAKSLSTPSFLITRLCVTVIDLANKLLLVALIALNLGDDYLVLILIVPIILRFCLRVLSVLALVVAAMEGRCGIQALRRAVGLVGRRWRRLVSLALFQVLIDPTFYRIFNLALSYVDGPAGPVVWAAMRVVQVAGMAAWGMWALAAHVMFYCEAGTQSCGEEEVAVVNEGREKGGSDEYSALPGDRDHP